jgi:hypothetical protein
VGEFLCDVARFFAEKSSNLAIGMPFLQYRTLRTIPCAVAMLSTPLYIQINIHIHILYNGGLLGQKLLESLLLDNHISHSPKLLPAFLLLLEQLAPATEIASMQLRQDILAKRLDSRSGDDAPADGCLDNYLKHLAIDVLLELLDPRAAHTVDLARVHDARDGIDGVAVDEELDLLDAGAVEARVFVVERGVALCGAFELAEEVVDEVGEREVVLEDDLCGGEEGEFLLLAAVGFAQLDDLAEVVGGEGDGGHDVGLVDFLDLLVGLVLVGELVGVRDDGLLAVAPDDLEGDRGGRDDDVGAVLLAQAVFKDGAVQRTQKAEPPPRAEGVGRLLLQRDAAVVEDNLVDALLEVLVLVLVGRKGSDKDHALGLDEAGQRLHQLLRADGGVRVAHLGLLRALHARIEVDVANLAGAQHRLRALVGVLDADLAHDVLDARGKGADRVAGPDLAVEDAHEQDDALVHVVPRVDEQQAQRGVEAADGSGDLLDDGGQQGGDVVARLGRDHDGRVRVDFERVVDLLEHAGRVGVGEVDLVQHGHEGEALGEGEVEVGDRLRLHALAGIHEQQGAAAAGVAARHLGAEVDVTGRVDEMEQVVLAVVVVYHGARLRLDRDAALALDVELVENLLVAAHGDGARELEQAVRQGALAMVDVGDDAEVAEAVHRNCRDTLLELVRRAVRLRIAPN